MRTTLTIDDDALELAKELGRRRRIPLGRAVSELVRRGARRALQTETRDGFEVVVLPDDSPEVTSDSVAGLEDETP